RDARMTPVKGRMAWFGLREWSLGVEVERAETIYSAEVTAYALPRARTVEIEGQFTLDISGAPLRSFQAVLPVAVAGLLRVTSPLVGEQQINEETGLWTFTLRQETRGRPNIRFRMSLPAAGDQTTQAALPRFEMPQARRFQGTWVIEANTDTQLSFETRSMQPLDVLRAPGVVGYLPRHRLVSAFTYGAGASALTITAQRHDRSELAVLLVKSLRMTSALSTDGTSRHEAVIDLRHSGEQFLPVRLPPTARLLSVLVEHVAYKPVRGEEGVLAIPLPADSANRANVRIQLLYDLPGEGWGGAGSRQLVPVTFPGNVPILTTDWRVHVPEGFSYGEVDTRLTQEEGPIPESPAMRARRNLPLDMDFERTSLETNQLLNRVVLRKVQMAGASLPDAVNFLRQQLANQSQIPGASAIRIVYLPGDNPHVSQISLDLTDVPFETALRYITELGGMTYRITPGRVTIMPLHSAEGRMMTRIFKVPSDIVARLATHHRGHGQPDPFAPAQANDPGTPEPPGAPGWWIDTLKAQGIVFDSQAEVVFDEDRSELVVVNSEPNLDLVKLLLDSLLTAEERAVYGIIEPPQAPVEDPIDYLTRKMRSIVFPSVEFQDATLEEALEFLRVKSRDLDSDPDPARKGLSMLFKPGEVPATNRISLSLRDVSLDVALRYVTELAGMTYKVEPYAILVMPVSETTTERYTRSYRVPRDFLISAGMPQSAVHGSAMDILKAQGIQFSEGDSATFNPITSQLIVRNTQPNLDLVESFVQSFCWLSPSTTVASKSGLMPLELELPTSGILLRFRGAQAPEPLKLSFISWERQLASSAMWILLGAAGFLLWGRKRIVWRSLLIILLLLAGVPLLVPSWQAAANGLLAGWMMAGGGWLLWRIVL
ncbi:MAG TPA: hypothetical protein VD994_08610, partial [Prosthecobacter sp.]|nr:hypothetical protein [Prosthecobacter sp.]